MDVIESRSGVKVPARLRGGATTGEPGARPTLAARQDDKDRLLLAQLVANGRLSNRELARKVGLSPSACLARLRRLEATGVIVGYRAIIARKGNGGRIEGWASIRFVDASREATGEFMRILETTPEIIEAHRIAGDHDYGVRICTGDIDMWNEFRRKLDVLGCQVEVRLAILLEAVK